MVPAGQENDINCVTYERLASILIGKSDFAARTYYYVIENKEK